MNALPGAASVRALAVDLDGTLLASNHRVTDETLRALEVMRARGAKLILATARTERRCQDIATLVVSDAVISCAGSLARAGGVVVYNKPLAAARANLVVRACKALGARISTLTEDDVHWINYPKVHQDSVETDFNTPLTTGAYHISVHLPYPALADDIARAAGCAVFRFSDSAWVRFGHIEASKERALEAVLASFGIAPGQTVAFGDDAVDIGMLRLCGCGVAMGNATAEVKTHADWVTGANDEDGIASFLRRLEMHGG